MSKNKTKIIAVLLLLLLAAAAAFAYFCFSPKAGHGDKEIFVTVIHGDGTKKEFQLDTKAETLRAALEPEEIIAGSDGPYGLFVLTVDGETADENLQQWWCITKGGETVTSGVDDIVISDGDRYEITLTTGW